MYGVSNQNYFFIVYLPALFLPLKKKTVESDLKKKKKKKYHEHFINFGSISSVYPKRFSKSSDVAHK